MSPDRLIKRMALGQPLEIPLKSVSTAGALRKLNSFRLALFLECCVSQSEGRREQYDARL